jgi:integrase
LLRAVDSYEGQPETRHALQLLPLVFVRPGELRHAEWSEFDLDAAVWSIPAAKMKMRRDHRLPLSEQAVAILREIHRLTGRGKFVFPSIRSKDRPMSNNTMNAALRRMGFGKNEMTAHGFRSVASTFLNESGKWSVDAIERALAHGEKNSVRAAYDRGDRWNERVLMMQWWADHLEELKSN